MTTLTESRLTQMSRENPKMQFTSLMGMLSDTSGLTASFERQPIRKALGVDGITKDAYAERLPDRISDLSARLRRSGYRPKPVRRTYIPKSNGGMRPLGIPSFEDRIVQDRMSRMLQAIYEPEFRACSYGFRPNRSAHDALRKLGDTVGVRTQWVVEADIKGFFNHVCHHHLIRFLKHRITDPVFLRTIHRFLKGGVLEDGVFSATEEGTPQGGLVSPVLSNIYLHYVLDWWFEGTFAKRCTGKATLVRYADDYVACFESGSDARDFLSAMTERLTEFGLEVEPTKTAILRFGRFAEKDCGKDGRTRPETFTFLGLTHYVGQSRNGKYCTGRKTEAKRMRAKLKNLNQRVRQMRTLGAKEMVTYVRQHLNGHINYYGVSGNSHSVFAYVRHAGNTLFKWLNRRSQRRSITWDRWLALIKQGLLPKARIVHDFYSSRLAKT
jgi:group II intron reverse transcriptase/maturase